MQLNGKLVKLQRSVLFSRHRPTSQEVRHLAKLGASTQEPPV